MTTLFKKNQKVRFSHTPGKTYTVHAHSEAHGVSLVGHPGNVDPAALAPVDDATPAKKSTPKADGKEAT